MPKFNPDYVTTPADTLMELLIYHNMSEQELRQKLPDAAKILDDEPVTSEIAKQLEAEFGISASYWLEHQKLYEKGVKDAR